MADVYGTAPGWRVESYQVDKNGGATLEVVKPWEPILSGQDDRLTLPDVPEPPTIEGWRVSAGGWKRTKTGGLAMAFQYEGVRPTGGGGQGGEEIGVRWKASGSIYQKDIRTVANWEKVRRIYQWDDKLKEFPDLLPPGLGLDSPWVATDEGLKKLNPLRGVKSIDDFSGVLTKTYLAKSIPAGIYMRINRIIKKPHSAMPDLGERDWKYMAPEWEEHGDYYRVYEHLELSGPGGWNKDLYGEPLRK